MADAERHVDTLDSLQDFTQSRKACLGPEPGAPGVTNKSEGRDPDRHQTHVSLDRGDVLCICDCFVLLV